MNVLMNRQYKILVVDDELFQRQAIISALNSENYEIESCINGTDAIDLCPNLSQI